MKLKTTVKVLSFFKYKYLLILMKWKFSAEENQTYQVDEEGFHVKNKLFLWSTTSVTKVAINHLRSGGLSSPALCTTSW